MNNEYHPLTLERCKEMFKEELENPAVSAISNWYARGPTPLGTPQPFDAEKFERKLMENADTQPHILSALDDLDEIGR